MGYSSTSKIHDLFEVDLKATKKEILDALGDIDDFEVWGNQVLIAVFCRPPTLRRMSFNFPRSSSSDSLF